MAICHTFHCTILNQLVLSEPRTTTVVDLFKCKHGGFAWFHNTEVVGCFTLGSLISILLSLTLLLLFLSHVPYSLMLTIVPSSEQESVHKW